MQNTEVNMQNNKSNNLATNIIKAFGLAILITLALGYVLGYRAILVNGWSAQPQIPYHSLIVDCKTSLGNLKEGDYITFKNSSNYTTHRIIAIKKDGYFANGEIIDVTINDKQYKMVVGKNEVYDINTPDSEIPTSASTQLTNYNIITMQSGEANANKDYINYDNVVGKVIYCNYLIGENIFSLRNNPYILFGLLGLAVITLIAKDQFDPTPENY